MIFYLKSYKIIDMKRLFFLFICLNLLFLGVSAQPGALEIELTGGLNNLTFHPDRITAHGQSDEFREFEGYPYILGNFLIKGDINEKLSHEIRLYRDNILQNNISWKLSTNMDYFNLEFGPFAGMGDKLEKPDLGVTGGLELSLPGIVFLAINGSSTLSLGFDFLGNSTRETAEVKLGFWIPNIITTFSVSIKNFTRQPNEFLILQDELIRYMLNADLYGKNAPLIFSLWAGYETFYRSYNWGNTETSDRMDAIFAGAELRWKFSRQFSVIGGFELPVYVFETKPMELPAKYFTLYNFNAGVSFTFY